MLDTPVADIVVAVVFVRLCALDILADPLVDRDEIGVDERNPLVDA